ncbi:MAG: hypothetical protein J6J07_03470 [Oscillospiraceae bacterium]|nr:hypothetical protein [Oscillospiraceae bacterium]
MVEEGFFIAAGVNPRPTLNYGGCGYYPTRNFALCILNYEFVFRLWQNPSSLIGEGYFEKIPFWNFIGFALI